MQMFWSLFAEMLLELEEPWSVKIASSQYRDDSTVLLKWPSLLWNRNLNISN